MPESEEFNGEKYRFIIYHGHIHMLVKQEENENPDNFYKKKQIMI